MNGTKRCEVILAYGGYRVGDEIYPTAMHRDWLLSRGYIRICEPMKSNEPVAAVAVAELPSDEPPVKKRGRPRKKAVE